MPADRLNPVPIALYFAAHFYFPTSYEYPFFPNVFVAIY
jgi:hypothetical protein